MSAVRVVGHQHACATNARAADAPLARKETIDLTDLADWQLVTLLNPYRVLGRISAAIERVHLETPSVIRTNSSAAALQMVKAGTPVLQLVLLPTPSTKEKREEEAGRAVLGCADGTVRLWDPRCRKANKALTPLKFTHKDYVGELRLAGDGPRTLSGVCV